MTDSSQVHVRRPEAADVERLAEINVVTWQRAYAGIVPAAYLDGLDFEAMRARWVRNLSDELPDISFRVADVDGTPASYLIVGPYRPQEDADPAEDTGDWGEIFALYTHPDLQGRGAGGLIHTAGLQLLRDQGFRRAALWVLAANERSQRWYAARGWRPDGVTSQWDGSGEPLDELRLVRDLSSDGMV